MEIEIALETRKGEADLMMRMTVLDTKLAIPFGGMEFPETT